MNTGYCVMPNGEHLRFERWAYEAYVNGRTTDSALIAMFWQARRIVVNW